MRQRKIIWLLIPLAFILFISIISFEANATVTISNVSPSDGAIHVDIIENVNGSYVNLSFTLTSSGGSYIEYYLDVMQQQYYSWWNITINNTGSALTNYPVKIEITNPDFFNYAQEKADIRVYDADKTTPLPYWIETFNKTSNECIIWVNVTSIPSGNKYIYIYTNESLTTDLSNGSAVFDFFDDFDTSTLMVNGYTAGLTLNGDGTAIFDGGSSHHDVWAGYQISGNAISEMKVKINYANPTTSLIGITLSKGTEPQGYNALLDERATQNDLQIRRDGSSSNILGSGSKTGQIDITKWYLLKFLYKTDGTMSAEVYEFDTGTLFDTASATDTTYSTPFYIGMHTYDAGLIDWIRVRKYVATEPTIKSITKESEGSFGLWFNRIHDTSFPSGSSSYHHEEEFNQTNTTYYWRIRAKDLGDGTWNNQTFTFRTDAKPSVLPVSPENNSYKEAGNIELSAVVYHPDYEWGFTGLSFDGSNDEVVIPHSDDFNVSSFTVDTYINVTTVPSTNSYNAIICHKDSSGNGYGVALYENHTGIMYLLSDINGVKTYCNCTYLVVDTWYHIVVTYDANTHMLTFYINGNKIDSIFVSEVPAHAIADLMIGGPPYTGLYKNFNGLMDYIRLYNRALTPSEVKANYYGKNDNCVTDGLVGYWKFDEGSGTTASDSSGKGHDGTLENGVSWTTQGGGSTTYYGKIYNVTFYEYPSGRIIGWNSTATGWTNGQIVKCNTTFYSPYTGTKYYWYAKAKDDEYWSENSSIYVFTTYYNETNNPYITTTPSASIDVYDAGTQSDTINQYYGAEINILQVPHIYNPSPNNTTINFKHWQQCYVTLSVDVNKSGNETYWYIAFWTNNTDDGNWSILSNNSYLINSTLQTFTWDMYNIDYNSTYYWKVTMWNGTYNMFVESPIYSFTTSEYPPYNESMSNPLVLTYPSTSIDIYDAGEQSDIINQYYSSNITVYSVCSFYNPSPNNTTVDFKHWQQCYVTLSIGVNRTGDINNFTIEFLSNNTGSWEVKNIQYAQIPPNATFTYNLYNIDYNKTYYWRVRVSSNET